MQISDVPRQRFKCPEHPVTFKTFFCLKHTKDLQKELCNSTDLHLNLSSHSVKMSWHRSLKNLCLNKMHVTKMKGGLTFLYKCGEALKLSRELSKTPGNYRVYAIT